jgi:TPR repeat protein
MPSFISRNATNKAGVSRNGELAIELYRSAAEHGHALSQNAIGCGYLFGNGLPQSGALAALSLRRAAVPGLHHALLNLARLYLSGKGVAKDVVLAGICSTW